MALLALAPLIFNFRLREVAVPGPREVVGMTGQITVFKGQITLNNVTRASAVKTKESPVWWYLLVMGMTLYGAILAMILALLVIPRTIDVYRGYSIAGTDALDLGLRVLLLGFALVSLFFSRKVIADSLKQGRARLI